MVPTDLFHDILPPSWESVIPSWLQEDIPSFDNAAYVLGSTQSEATLFCKSSGVVAGKPFFDAIFKYLNCSVNWLVDEGAYITIEQNEKKAIAKVYGPTRLLLQGERCALNLIARCSGIATRARQLTEIKIKHSFNGVIAGTRKTTPGFRLVEKYGLLVGGADPHRMDLSSMIMLKDNHISAVGSIEKAVQKARQVGGFTLKIEVECKSYQDALEALKAGADIVMLDHVAKETFATDTSFIKSKYPHAIIEISGNVTLENVHEYFAPDVDVISMGSLTQGVPHVDFSLKLTSTQNGC